MLRVDSLLTELKRSTGDLKKLDVLGSLSLVYSDIDADAGLKYGKDELLLAMKLRKEKAVALAYNNMALNFTAKNLPDSAMNCLLLSLKINRGLNDKKWIGANLQNIGNIYLKKSQADSALKYYLGAKTFLETAGDKGFLASDLECIGAYYNSISDYNQAIEYINRAMKMFEELQDRQNASICYGTLSTVYKSIGDYPDALKYAFNALKIAEQIGDKTGTLAAFINISGIYFYQEDHQKVLENSFKALNVARDIKDEMGTGVVLMNIGNEYRVKRDYQAAMNYFEQALTLFKEIDYQNGIGKVYGNMCYLCQVQHFYNQSLEYGFNALKIFQASGDKQGIAWDVSNIGETYLVIAKDEPDTIRRGRLIPRTKKENLKLAVSYICRGIDIDEQIGNLYDLIDCYHALSEAQAMLGNDKDALTSYTKYYELRDSVFSQKNSRALAGIEAKREAELRETKIEQQRLQIVAVKNERKYFIAGIASLLLLTSGIFGRFRITRRNKRLLEQKNMAIAAEKENADAMRQRAEASERFKQQFLANMSHEIRTPMNAVNGMTDLLLEKGPRADQVEYLTAISKSSDILLHIINDILDLSKIEAGKLELEKIDFSLEDALKQVKDTLSYKAEEKGLQLITHIAGDVPDVFSGDPFRLNQVLINLGGNAIKFTERGSVQLNVNLLAESGDDVTLRFSVTDTGIGIPPGKLQSLFGDFVQVNSSDTRKFGGTGLGLSISKQLVELQNGTIAVESNEGSGTTFYFTITYSKGSEKELLQRLKQEQKAGRLRDGLRILIADDNEYNRLVVNETLLLKARVNTDLVTNGQEAIQRLKTNDYDVILMDVQMPVMNGIEATKYIRTQMAASKKNIPIIALTASVLKADLDICSASGMNSYVPKPFKAWQLIQSIAEVTGSGKGEQEPTPEAEKSRKTAPGQVTDLTYLRDFCEGDEERIKKYIDLYLKAAPVFKEKLTRAVAAKDMNEIALQVHSFKPKWMMMGMRATGELASKIDQLCKEGASNVYDDIFLLIQQTDVSVVELNANR